MGIARRLDAGYEDGNDALRTDPVFKPTMDRLSEHGNLCPQSTVSRTENLPDRHAPAAPRLSPSPLWRH
nr:hypothetical protein [Defluviicoccus vanus]